MTCHLIIFAKVPEPGRVKTRLCEHITCEEAVELYDAFVADTVGMAASAGAFHVTLAYTPESAGGYFTDRFDGLGVEFIPQEGADLGMRMHHALSRAFGHGADRAALIGTDIPTLTAGEIKDAFARLENSDVVIGPANDGGYFLVAMKRPQPGIFEGVAWSTPHVLNTTLERADAMGLTVSLIPGHTDVDTVMDLAALSGLALPENTRAVVERLRPKLASL
jgi:hypothetical protein